MNAQKSQEKFQHHIEQITDEGATPKHAVRGTGGGVIKNKRNSNSILRAKKNSANGYGSGNEDKEHKKSTPAEEI
jgi:shikimate kinase